MFDTTNVESFRPAASGSNSERDRASEALFGEYLAMISVPSKPKEETSEPESLLFEPNTAQHDFDGRELRGAIILSVQATDGHVDITMRSRTTKDIGGIGPFRADFVVEKNVSADVSRENGVIVFRGKPTGIWVDMPWPKSDIYAEKIEFYNHNGNSYVRLNGNNKYVALISWEEYQLADQLARMANR